MGEARGGTYIMSPGFFMLTTFSVPTFKALLRSPSSFEVAGILKLSVCRSMGFLKGDLPNSQSLARAISCVGAHSHLCLGIMHVY